MRKCLLLLFAIIALGIILDRKDSEAVGESTDATITVITPVAGTENFDMQLGKITRPTSGTNTVTLSISDTRTISGAGDGSLVVSPLVRAAEYTITATAGETVTFEAAETSSITGISLDNFKGRYDGGSVLDIDVGDGASVTAIASATFEVGADLTIDNTVASGVHTLDFDLTINFP